MVDMISEHTVVVNGWHGTPKLFAHLVRVVHEVTAGDLLVDVAVGADHERFGSAEDFLDHLSPEALRTFSSIAVHADGPAGSVRLTFEWLRSWWKPGLSPDTQIVVRGDGPAGQPPEDRDRAAPASRRFWASSSAPWSARGCSRRWRSRSRVTAATSKCCASWCRYWRLS